MSNAQDLAANSSNRLPIAILLISLIVLFVTSDPSRLTNWVGTHWLFNYDAGFIKRGLVGEIYSWVFPQISLASLQVHMIAIIVVFELFYFGFILSTASCLLNFGSSENSASRSLLVAALLFFSVTSSALLQQYFYDFGRFDIFGALILLLNSAIILRCSKSVSACSIGLTCLVGIAIHEAFLVWLAPPLVCLWTIRNWSGLQSVIVAFSILGSLALCTLFIFYQTYENTVGFDEMKIALQNRSDFQISDSSLMVQYRDLKQNIGYTFSRAFEPERLPGLLFLTPIFAFHVVKCAILSRPSVGGSRIGTAAVLLSCVAPLCLVLFGHDHGRWFAMCLTSLMIVSHFFIQLRPATLLEHPTRWAVAFFILSAAQIALGPIGVTRIYPTHF